MGWSGETVVVTTSNNGAGIYIYCHLVPASGCARVLWTRRAACLGCWVCVFSSRTHHTGSRRWQVVSKVARTVQSRSCTWFWISSSEPLRRCTKRQPMIFMFLIMGPCHDTGYHVQTLHIFIKSGSTETRQMQDIGHWYMQATAKMFARKRYSCNQSIHCNSIFQDKE